MKSLEPGLIFYETISPKLFCGRWVEELTLIQLFFIEQEENVHSHCFSPEPRLVDAFVSDVFCEEA